MTEQRVCEAGEFGWDDCENPATTTAKWEGETAHLCRECYEGVSYAVWEGWYRSAAR